MIPQNIHPGARLNLSAFGYASIERIYTHKETAETCVNVKTDGGHLLHLSLKYAASKSINAKDE